MKKNAAVFILLGQSNATGHATPMAEEDKILSPLKNVFGLSREKNQSFDNKELFFTGYTSFGMNLAEEQDNTYSLANCLARRYQNEIDNGNTKLPDLYIVQIAIGAQGVTKGFMWNPNYEKKLIPGMLGTCDIALFPYTVHILSLLNNYFDSINKNMTIMGFHWRGSEEDELKSIGELETELKDEYDILFNGFKTALRKDYVVTLHKVRSDYYEENYDPNGEHKKSMEYIQSFFDNLANNSNEFEVFDPISIPFYVKDDKNHGIYLDDHVHFTKEATED